MGLHLEGWFQLQLLVLNLPVYLLLHGLDLRYKLSLLDRILEALGEVGTASKVGTLRLQHQLLLHRCQISRHSVEHRGLGRLLALDILPFDVGEEKTDVLFTLRVISAEAVLLFDQFALVVDAQVHLQFGWRQV